MAAGAGLLLAGLLLFVGWQNVATLIGATVAFAMSLWWGGRALMTLLRAIRDGEMGSPREADKE